MRGDAPIPNKIFGFVDCYASRSLVFYVQYYLPYRDKENAKETDANKDELRT
jgi:hypothetical protein